MNTKGSRAERRAIRILEAGTARLSGVEREQIAALTVPPAVSCECWRFPDRCRAPLIERL